MKDPIHHRKYTQKKVIQSLRKNGEELESSKNLNSTAQTQISQLVGSNKRSWIYTR